MKKVIIAVILVILFFSGATLFSSSQWYRRHQVAGTYAINESNYIKLDSDGKFILKAEKPYMLLNDNLKNNNGILTGEYFVWEYIGLKINADIPPAKIMGPRFQFGDNKNMIKDSWSQNVWVKK